LDNLVIHKTLKTPDVFLDVKLHYANTSSLQFLYDILFLLDEVPKTFINITINWYCSADDNDMIELGNDFKIAVDLKVNVIEI